MNVAYLHVQNNILPNIQEEIYRGISITALPSGIVQFHALVVLCYGKKRCFSPDYH